MGARMRERLGEREGRKEDKQEKKEEGEKYQQRKRDLCCFFRIILCVPEHHHISQQ